MLTTSRGAGGDKGRSVALSGAAGGTVTGGKGNLTWVSLAIRPGDGTYCFLVNRSKYEALRRGVGSITRVAREMREVCIFMSRYLDLAGCALHQAPIHGASINPPGDRSQGMDYEKGPIKVFHEAGS
ncbi:hypothetical protein FRC06_004906 [Ceratobasidium sp. 370]|nr:hypothetical protein FRC06_004906 [Ceratobasidium sp. 370]